MARPSIFSSVTYSSLTFPSVRRTRLSNSRTSSRSKALARLSIGVRWVTLANASDGGSPTRASRAERAMRAFEAFGGRCSHLDDRGQADRQDLHADLVELDDDLLIGPRHRALQDGAAAPGPMLHLVSRPKSLNQLDRRGWTGGIDEAGGRHAGVGNAGWKPRGPVNQVGGNVLEKARGQVQVRAAPEMAAER